jgi:hypothetical protein
MRDAAENPERVSAHGHDTGPCHSERAPMRVPGAAPPGKTQQAAPQCEIVAFPPFSP